MAESLNWEEFCELTCSSLLGRGVSRWLLSRDMALNMSGSMEEELCAGSRTEGCLLSCSFCCCCWSCCCCWAWARAAREVARREVELYGEPPCSPPAFCSAWA